MSARSFFLKEALSNHSDALFGGPMDFLLRFLKKHYGHPLVGQLDIDSAGAVTVHHRIILENPLLRRYYASMYRYFQEKEKTVEDLNFSSLEIGCGGGFIKEYLPGVITSDVVAADWVDRVEDASSLNFGPNSLKAIYANGVLHHIKDPVGCLSEIERVLAPGGVFVCNEPSSTRLGYFMNRHFHHEATDRDVCEWNAGIPDQSGRLSGANMALPYIIFRRDAALFAKRFPNLKI